MDCRSCQPILLDLLFGELPPDSSVEARRHLEQCESCSSALSKLDRGLALARELPQAAAPEAAHAAIMAMAESHAAEVEARAARESAPPQSGAWQSLLDLLGRLAMAPQVGMATIMVLVVALGLWWVPQLSKEPQLASDAVVHPEAESSATAPGVRPADPLELQFDHAQRRIRPRGQAHDRLEQPVAPLDTLAIEEEARADDAVKGEAAPAGRERAVLAEKEPGLEGMPSEALASRGGGSTARAVKRARRPAPVRKAAPVHAPDFGEPSAFPDSLQASQSARPEARAAGNARMNNPYAKPIPGAAQESAEPSLGNDRARAQDLLRRAQLLHRQRNYAAAVATLTELKAIPGVGSLSLEAELLHARVLREWQGCRSALSKYQLAAARAGTQQGPALLELAECQDSLGDTAAARAALKRAATLRSSAATAGARLRALDAPELAPAAAPPAPAPASGAAEPAADTATEE